MLEGEEEKAAKDLLIYESLKVLSKELGKKNMEGSKTKEEKKEVG